MDVQTVATLHNMRSSGRFSIVETNAASNNDSHADYRVTFINFLGMFFSDLVAYWQQDDNNDDRDRLQKLNAYDSEYVKIADITVPLITSNILINTNQFNKRMSMLLGGKQRGKITVTIFILIIITITIFRLDFRSYLNPLNEAEESSGGIDSAVAVDWPAIEPNNIDILVGGLNPDVVNQTLIKWVLDGATKIQKKNKKDVTKILRRVRHALKLHGKKLAAKEG